MRDVLRRLQGHGPVGLVGGRESRLLVALEERLEVIVDAEDDPELFGFLQREGKVIGIGGGVTLSNISYCGHPPAAATPFECVEWDKNRTPKLSEEFRPFWPIYRHKLL